MDLQKLIYTTFLSYNFFTFVLLYMTLVILGINSNGCY